MVCMVTMVGGVLPKYFIPHKLQRKHWKQKILFTRKKPAGTTWTTFFEKKSLIVKKYVLLKKMLRSLKKSPDIVINLPEPKKIRQALPPEKMYYLFFLPPLPLPPHAHTHTHTHSHTHTSPFDTH